jgi:hypothetical protein
MEFAFFRRKEKAVFALTNGDCRQIVAFIKTVILFGNLLAVLAVRSKIKSKFCSF